MFPQDGQMLVDGFRYQNFGIWTIFGWVIAVLAKKDPICLYYCIKSDFMVHFYQKCYNSAKKGPNSKISVSKSIY